MKIKGETEKCVGYGRCSTDMQDRSIEQQQNELSAWAAKHGYRITGWYIDEGKSGTSFLKRPGFMRLLKDVEGKHSFTSVLVYDESRWSRANDPRESNYWKFHFKRKGVKVIIINSKSQNGNDVGSYVVEVVEAAEASEYSRKISRATKRGQKENALSGFSSGGSAPYGYRRIAVNKVTGEFIRDLPPGTRSYPDEKVLFDLGDPHEVETVRRIFRLKLEGLGYKTIANILNKEGVPCPKRGRWKNKDQKWSANTLYTIVTNPIYTGKRVFNRHPQSHLAGPNKELWFSKEEDWVVRKNSHPAIISEEIFDQINNRRKPYERTNRFFLESSYLLTGLLKCKSCGYNFQGQTRTLISKASGEEYKIQYYQDSGYNNKGKAVCSSFLLRKDVLEGVVIKQIKKFIKNKKFIDKVRENIECKLMNNSEVDSLLSNIKSQIENNKSVLKNLLELVRNGVNLREVQDEIIRVNKEMDYLERNYNDIKEKEITNKDVDNILDKIKKLISNFEKTLSKAPLHIQKNILKQFIEEVIVDPHTGIIECKFRRVPWINNGLTNENIFGSETIEIDLSLGVKASRRAS